MMKKMFLFCLTALMLTSVSGQTMKLATAKHSAPMTKLMQQPQCQEMQMREPGSAVTEAPRRAGSAQVYYKRPAGAFPGFLAIETGTHDLLGYYQFTTLQVAPYVPYTYRGVATGTLGDPRFTWQVPYLNIFTNVEDVLDASGQQDVTVSYGAMFVDAPTMEATDDLDTYSYQLSTNINGDGIQPVGVMPWPDWGQVVDDNIELLKSSSNFSYITDASENESTYPFTLYSGMTPHGSNDYGYWFGKNGGYNGVHVDGIAQAFERPEHPYLLKEVLLFAYNLNVTSNVEMKCKIYRIDGVPAYSDTSSVVLPEQPGELIAMGSAQLTANDSGDDLVAFTLYTPIDGDWSLPYPAPITIDDAIMVVIDGYNDPEMSALSDFSAFIGTETHVDDGYGERAYLKVGRDDDQGNFDGTYQWCGLNNFFRSGEMKTGLSIFLNTELPFLANSDTNDAGEFTFPASGGVMSHTVTDDNGETVTLDGIRFISWQPYNGGEWSVTCDGEEPPTWLDFEFTDGNTDGEFNYLVNAKVTAQPLEAGTDYREATVRFAIPGTYMDYKFIQTRQGGEDPDTIQEVTPMPEFSVEMNDTAVTVNIIANGTIKSYLDGTEWNCTRFVFYRDNCDYTAVITATAQEQGKRMSDTARIEVFVPARETAPVVQGYSLTMDNATVSPGDTIVIPVALRNEGPIQAFQTDIELPEGFELVSVNGKYAIGLSDRAASDHTWMANEVGDGKVRLLCYSPNNTPFSDNEGDLFYFAVKVPEDATGDAVVRLCNTLLTLDDFTECPIDIDACATLTIKPFIPGDANDNGEVTVSDIVTTARYILELNPDPFAFDAADMNGDSQITITDIALIANVILHPSAQGPSRVQQVLRPANERMSGEDFTLTAGETRTVSINLDNSLEYTGFQLDLRLPDGLTASNFALTGRSDKHSLAINTLTDGGIRALCYSPKMDILNGEVGAIMTFDVTAMGNVRGTITANGIEMVTGSCQTVLLDGFAMTVNGQSAINELIGGRSLTVKTEDRDIIVESPESRTISIVDVAGHIRRVKVNNGRTVITGNESGIYIVIADGTASKLLLR